MNRPNKSDFDRCDWCGWPLKKTIEEGCAEFNCSQRPLPKLGEIGELKQVVRRLRAENAELRRAADTYVPKGILKHCYDVTSDKEKE